MTDQPGDAVESCPTCGRWLVRIHRDGSFDLNAKASFVLRVIVRTSPPPITPLPLSPSPGSAVCKRLGCRVRRLVGGDPAPPEVIA